MSKIPYQFYPIPHEFFKDEFIEDPLMMKLIRYIMKKISACPRKTTFKNNRTLITVELQPFEFIFGRKACAEELGVSEKIIRLRMEKLRASSYLKEMFVKDISSEGVNRERASSWASSSEGKRASTFSVYRLSTESFSKLNGQQFLYKKGQQLFEEKTTPETSVEGGEQREGQQLGHKQEERRSIRDKKEKYKKEKILPFEQEQQPIAKIQRFPEVLTSEEEHADLLKYIQNKKFMEPGKESILLEAAYEFLSQWKSTQPEEEKIKCTDIGRLRGWVIKRVKKEMIEEEEIRRRENRLKSYPNQGNNASSEVNKQKAIEMLRQYLTPKKLRIELLNKGIEFTIEGAQKSTYISYDANGFLDQLMTTIEKYDCRKAKQDKKETA